MMSPTVSVVLACYRSAWVAEAIGSVLDQTLGDWELLVLDDSPDAGARETALSFGDQRIRYLHNERQLGPARNHARGFSEARAGRISIINHDDVWEPNLLETLVGALDDERGAVAAFSDHFVIREDGTIDEESTREMSEKYGRLNLRAGLISGEKLYRVAVVDRAIPVAQCCVIDGSHVPSVPRWVGGAYDFYIATQLAATGGPIAYVPERLARFRTHPTNLGSHRSPVRDLVQAGIYMNGRRGAPPDVSRHALREACRAIANTPRSLVRLAQAQRQDASGRPDDGVR